MGDGPVTLRDWQAFHGFLAWDAGDYDAGSDLEHAPACSICSRPGARKVADLAIYATHFQLRLCQICHFLLTQDPSFAIEIFQSHGEPYSGGGYV